MKSWIGLVSVLVFCEFASCYIDKTVYQCLADKGFTRFLQLAKESRLDQVLSGPGPVTVFAPTDVAVNGLSHDMLASLTKNPLQQKNLVKYHMVDGYDVLPKLTGTTELMTNSGEKLHLLHIGQSVILNNTTRIDSAPNNDIVCNNGVIQPIDHVLIPPHYSTDNLMAVLIERDDLFQEFVMGMLVTTNLSRLIENGEYTIFAPVDAAWAPYVQRILHPSVLAPALRREIFDEMFKYHIVPGARWKDTLQHGQSLFTLHGTPVNITELISGTLVNQAHVLEFDIPAANGVIHAIDHVLFPGDLRDRLIAMANALSTTTQP